MLRLLGGVLLLASAFWLGRHASMRLRQRPRQLRSLIDALESLRADISALAPLSEALLHAGRAAGCGGAFLKRIASRLEQENRMLDEIWAEELQSMPLRLQERDSLSVLGTQLGKYDAATQMRALERCICDLKRWEQEATEKTRAEAGLWLRLIGVAGVLLLIVLW